MQAFILVHRYQHSPSTLFNILETIYDEVVLRKFAEGPATSLLCVMNVDLKSDLRQACSILLRLDRVRPDA